MTTRRTDEVPAPFSITKRKLTAAIKVARENGYISERLGDETSRTGMLFGSPILFWPESVTRDGEGRVAYIHTRSDSTIYVGYAAPCNANIPYKLFEPRASMGAR